MDGGGGEVGVGGGEVVQPHWQHPPQIAVVIHLEGGEGLEVAEGGGEETTELVGAEKQGGQLRKGREGRKGRERGGVRESGTVYLCFDL